MEGQKATLPTVGLFACFSGGSNSGSLTGMAALEVMKRLGSDAVGVCSLPAVLSQVPRQSDLVKRLRRIVVLDGCRNACAKRLLAGVGINPHAYLNLENDLGLLKKGPFTGLEFTQQEVHAVAEALARMVTDEAEGPAAPDRGTHA